jgi:RNA polymerase sigma-70 factor (ECF subfamily)
MEPSLRARVRDGDPDAFGELFDGHARAVHGLAYRLTGSRTESEEIVSLTFLEAWRLREKVEPDGESLRPWLLGITVNVARNFTRASRRHQAAMARLPEAGVVPDFADDVASRLDDAARLTAVRAAFGRLRPDEQDVVALCAWSGLDYSAAAAALEIPVGTVRSRLSRARQKLRDMAVPTAGHQPSGQQALGEHGAYGEHGTYGEHGAYGEPGTGSGQFRDDGHSRPDSWTQPARRPAQGGTR